MTRSFTRPITLLLASAATVGLAGCKLDNRPLLARRDAAPAAYVADLPPGEAALSYLPADYLPTVADLPPARALPVAYAGAERAWYYPEQAYRMDRVFYDDPPMYGFDYGDEEPWAWGGDEGLMFAEPVDYGYRYYYYEPDEPYPYFVRDRDYGYAYGDDGVLVALFTAAGALLSPDTYPRYADVAGRYWTRAYDLNRAYDSAPRIPVERTAWSQRAPILMADRQRWIRAAESQAPWRDYRERYQSDGGWTRQRQLIAAAPALPRGQAVAAARHEEKAWRDAAKADGREAKAEAKAYRQAAKHDDKAFRQQARAEAQAQQAAEVRARALRPIGQERPREMARAAGDQGRNASWRGPDVVGQQHPGGNPGHGRGKAKGQGGGHEDNGHQDKGGGGHGNGGGGGHGKGK